MVEVNRILQGDCLAVLKTLPDNSIDCCVTSPPYWGLRDYGTAEWEGGDEKCEHTINHYSDTLKPDCPRPFRGDRSSCIKCGAVRIDNQLGLETTPEEYVAKMVDVFREVRRVLKEEGVCWLNLGDSYWGGKGQSGSGNPEEQALRSDVSLNKPYHQIAGDGLTRPQDGKHPIIKPKDLVGIPWRVAFALQADGWYLRQDIIWHKPNPMPESVMDRCTKSHEYVFLLTKSAKYFYDSEAIKETATGFDGRKDTFLKGSQKYANGFVPNQSPQTIAVRGHERWKKRKNDDTNYGGDGGGFQDHSGYSNLDNPYVRNKRSVWTVNTKPYSGAHFATFPEDLIVPMIKAGCPEFVCKKCGKSKERIVDTTERIDTRPGYNTGTAKSGTEDDPNKDIHNSDLSKRRQVIVSKTTGYTDCGCGAEFEAGIVLDPFAGAGTTCMVAKKLWKNYIGIELNPEYVKLAETRIELECGTLF